jgi:large subunit ribosomal protein L15
MQLHELPKIVRRKKRVGRGIGGRGAKSGRGMKGQRSRAGAPRNRAGFEGGQTPLYMRLPKGRGTKTKNRSQVVKPVSITTSVLSKFSDGDIVGPGQLRALGLVPGRYDAVKLIKRADVGVKLTVRVHAISAGARAAVIDAGGKVEIIGAQDTDVA